MRVVLAMVTTTDRFAVSHGIASVFWLWLCPKHATDTPSLSSDANAVSDDDEDKRMATTEKRKIARHAAAMAVPFPFIMLEEGRWIKIAMFNGRIVDGLARRLEKDMVLLVLCLSLVFVSVCCVFLHLLFVWMAPEKISVRERSESRFYER